jgi:hypothetical protein
MQGQDMERAPVTPFSAEGVGASSAWQQTQEVPIEEFPVLGMVPAQSLDLETQDKVVVRVGLAGAQFLREPLELGGNHALA